ncbi:NUDIX hydrolase [Phytoactinopolyspora mesophila]|uniref:NUDIX domain-containing protein n=1 Tax=Phytoactinopolyspora mesophila TaxID=2650750 RepID=A0A7K3M8F3_9ACTN|nr:NUDIX hydrolase [Phytoactinopolyspora mesophila]NDL58698.1 NUDIX domain-containing protein [Phytoactinopolyspora mesophila]
MSRPKDDPVRAAGGVVWRSKGADVEIIVVHRPKYDDWSLPKGKLDPGETWEEAAAREVREETGLEVELGPFVDQVEYVEHGSKADRFRRPKVVRFWAMRAVGGTFTPHREVDAVRWLSPHDAIQLLTHELDHGTVQRFLTLPLQ